MARSTIIPNNNRDKMLFGFMVIGIPFAVVWLGFIILPEYHTSLNKVVILHFITCSFIFYNIFGNMFQVIKVDASGRTSFLPTILKPG